MPYGIKLNAGACLPIVVLATTIALPVASARADRCEELTAKASKGIFLTNPEKKEYMACPNKPVRRPTTSLPKPSRDNEPIGPNDLRPPSGVDADKPSEGAAGNDGSH